MIKKVLVAKFNVESNRVTINSILTFSERRLLSIAIRRRLAAGVVVKYTVTGYSNQNAANTAKVAFNEQVASGDFVTALIKEDTSTFTGATAIAEETSGTDADQGDGSDTGGYSGDNKDDDSGTGGYSGDNAASNSDDGTNTDGEDNGASTDATTSNTAGTSDNNSEESSMLVPLLVVLLLGLVLVVVGLVLKNKRKKKTLQRTSSDISVGLSMTDLECVPTNSLRQPRLQKRYPMNTTNPIADSTLSIQTNKAIQVVAAAVKKDEQRKYQEAIVLYESAIEQFKNIMSLETDGAYKFRLAKRLDAYLTRVQELKKYLRSGKKMVSDMPPKVMQQLQRPQRSQRPQRPQRIAESVHNNGLKNESKH